MTKGPILIVGVMEEKHVGGQLRNATEKLGVKASCMDVTEAYQGNVILRKIAWYFGRRPFGLSKFSSRVLAAAKKAKPSVVLTTGQAPLDEAVLEEMGEMGIFRANYSTDDPWNPAHQAGWFLRSLQQYDRVFSTRRANLDQFRGLGIQAEHLPFGYDPDLYFAPWDGRSHPDGDLDRGERIEDRGSEQDKVFLAGGGDEDRYPLVKALQAAGIGMSLWGNLSNRPGGGVDYRYKERISKRFQP